VPTRTRTTRKYLRVVASPVRLDSTDSRPQNHPGRHPQTRQILREPVRESSVDAVLDSGIESEPHPPPEKAPSRASRSRAGTRDRSAETPACAKVRVGFVGGGPLGTAAARRAGGRTRSARPKRFTILNTRPLPPPEDSRIQKDDGAKKPRALKGRERGEIARANAPREHGSAMALEALDELGDQMRPAVRCRMARVVAD